MRREIVFQHETTRLCYIMNLKRIDILPVVNSLWSIITFVLNVIVIVILEGTGKVTSTGIQTSAEQGPCDIVLTMLTKSALRFF